MNDQLQLRSEELRHVNAHLHSILGSLRAAVVVLNPVLEVEVWSDKAHDLWGLRSDEVEGQPFLALDIGLPVEQLQKPIRQCLDGSPQGATMVFDGVNRRGRPIRCQVTCSRLLDGPGVAGVILLMEEVSGESEAQRPN
jgi:two-component system, chemotaxis family, CheB/CheR fusion protein